MDPNIMNFPPVINLNVGGRKFTTRLMTFQKYPDSLLAAMFSGSRHIDQDETGTYVIDRNGKYFDHILDFLRDEEYVPPKDVCEDVLREAEYFCVFPLMEKLKGIPPLFPFYGILENIRTSVKEYYLLKKQVIKIAKSGVPNMDKNNFSDCNSQVVIQTFKRSPHTEKKDASNFQLYIPIFKEVESYLEVKKFLAGKHFENKTICEANEKIENFESFIETLVYDLNREGYIVIKDVKMKSVSYVKPNSSDRVIFNGDLYVVHNYAYLNFKWSFHADGR